MPIKYFLYARKSTEDEERQIMSIEAQLTELQEFAKRENIIIAKTFIESKSAKKPGREIFNEMMLEVEKSKESVGLLAWHPDRLARNSIDGGQIIYSIDTERIISLKFPTFWFEPTPQGLFMLQVAFGQSKYYSDNLSENVKRGIRQKLRRGEWPTKAPFGYVNNAKTRNIDPDHFKGKILSKAFQEFATSKHSLSSLSERLSFWGVVSSTGKPLVKAQMYHILTNKVYLGIIEHNGETYEGTFPALIKTSTFEAVQKVLKSRARPRKKIGGHHFSFCGLLTCEECKAAITAQYAHGHGGTYLYYRCSKKLGPCSQKYIQEKDLVTQIKTQLQTVSISDDWYARGLARITEWEQDFKNTNISFAQNLETKIIETDHKLATLVDVFLDGTLDKETYLRKKEQIVKQKSDFNQKKSDLRHKGTSRLEPMKEFWKAAYQAKKLALSNDFLEIKSFVSQHGSNPRLGGKTVSVSWTGGFEIIRTLAKKISSPSNAQNYDVFETTLSLIKSG